MLTPFERIYRDAIIAPANPIRRELMKNPEYDTTEWWLELHDSELEPLQYWFVGDEFARFLKERGHPVTTQFTGLAIWGRPTSGQSIEDDEVYKDYEAMMHRRYEEA